MPTFGDCEYSVDRDATVAAYRAASGGSSECKCSDCRNFVAARERVFPAGFLALLDELGIDPLKVAEVICMERSPGKLGYEGWFHFVGTMTRNRAIADAVKFGERFEIWFSHEYVPPLYALADFPVVAVMFYARDVPWLLAEPELD